MLEEKCLSLRQFVEDYVEWGRVILNFVALDVDRAVGIVVSRSFIIYTTVNVFVSSI